MRSRSTKSRGCYSIHPSGLILSSVFVILFLLASNLIWFETPSVACGTPDNTPHARPASNTQANLYGNFLSLSLGRQISSSTLDDETRAGIDEDLEGRSDWFTFQRAYPSNTIPADARLRAWRESRRYETDSKFGLQASQNWRPVGPSPTFSAFWGLTSGRVNAVAISPANS